MPLSDFDGEFVWWPEPETARHSNLARFMRRYGYPSLAALSPGSLDEVAHFWEAVLSFLDIQFYEPCRQIADFSRGIQWPLWCPGGVMNITHNCLDKWLHLGAGDRLAVRW